MDDDQVQADIKNAATAEASKRAEEKPREPRKRFVGRRTAAEKVPPKNGSNGTTEEIGVVQGLKHWSELC